MTNIINMVLPNQNSNQFNAVRFYADIFQNMDGIKAGLMNDRLRLLKLSEQQKLKSVPTLTNEVELIKKDETLIVMFYVRNIKNMTVNESGIIQHRSFSITLKCPTNKVQAELLKSALLEKIAAHLNESQQKLWNFKALKQLLAA